jgi:hypothetical protein
MMMGGGHVKFVTEEDVVWYVSIFNLSLFICFNSFLSVWRTRDV